VSTFITLADLIDALARAEREGSTRRVEIRAAADRRSVSAWVEDAILAALEKLGERKIHPLNADFRCLGAKVTRFPRA
jgi:hypothetical protein